MGFGEIVKKAWRVTWRHKGLWILGVFAGISGCQGSGSSSSGGNNFGGGGGSGRGTDFAPADGLRELGRVMDEPRTLILIAAIVVGGLLLISLVWWLIAIAARAGLVWGVNEAEEGRPARAGDSWNAGFGKWGRVLGLEVLLKGPVLVLTLGLLAAIFVPIVRIAVAGRNPDPVQVLGPMCGGLALGIPVLLVVSYVTGVLYLSALRFIVLDGRRTTESIGIAWDAFRARFKDHFLMYLFNWLLNVAASIVFAIPVVIITIAIILPSVIAGGSSEDIRPILGGVGLLLLLLIPLGLLYTGIWGTFTSALWTIFFRRLTGREVLVAPAPAAPVPPVGIQPVPTPPVPPAEPAPPVAPMPPVEATPPVPPAEPAQPMEPVTSAESAPPIAPMPPTEPAPPMAPETPQQ